MNLDNVFGDPWRDVTDLAGNPLRQHDQTAIKAIR